MTGPGAKDLDFFDFFVFTTNWILFFFFNLFKLLIKIREDLRKGRETESSRLISIEIELEGIEEIEEIEGIEGWVMRGNPHLPSGSEVNQTLKSRGESEINHNLIYYNIIPVHVTVILL